MPHNPVRIIEGAAKPYEPFWRVLDAGQTESGEAEIQFYGPISEYSWFGDEVTPLKFKADLDRLGGSPVTIRIHSDGGDVFAASAIRAMIMDYAGRVTTRIDGLAASAATYVAMAGDVVKMQDSAFFMIHDPWMMTWGTVDDLKDTINLLKTIKQGIVETYQSKTNLGAEEISKLMAAETWMTAQQAKERGFVDEVITSSAKTRNAANFAALNSLHYYRNLPEALRALMQTAPVDESNPEADRLRAEAKLYLLEREQK
jgi:ATP-dependent Clp protease protease subunit